jgi:hypothetical protein
MKPERTDTQRAIIRKHLLEGKSITPIEALQLCGCFRLSSVIHRLRHKDNIPIQMDQPEAPDNPYARYWVNKEYLKERGIMNE